jgi:uncharacterized protein (DUF1330 family)
MSAYLIVQVTVKDPVRYEQYKAMAPVSIAQYGGRYIVRGGKTETLEGSWSPKRIVVLEFPSMERAREWWNCAEYAEAKALRQATTDTEMLLVEGLA